VGFIALFIALLPMPTPLDPAAKKAYEVSYALFRVAGVLSSRSFADFLEKEALELLRASSILRREMRARLRNRPPISSLLEKIRARFIPGTGIS